MKKQPNRKNKRMILFLLMISLTLSTGTFAFWASNVEGTNEEATGTLSIGYAASVETTFELTNTLQDGGLLVPNGQIGNSIGESVEIINLSHNLVWLEDALQSQLEGTITTGKISITHSFIIELEGVELDSKEYSDIYELIHINYDESNPIFMTLDGDVEAFNYTITMDEPNNQEEYDLIHNANITVVFNYRVYDNFIETTDQVDGAHMSLLGDDVVYVEVSTTYTEPGVQAFNSIGDEIYRTWYSGEVNTWKVGTYTLSYSAYSSYDNETVTSIERTIVVVDTTAPVISISGPTIVNVSIGSEYSDWGAWAIDNSNEEVSITVEGMDEIDTNRAGTYYVTYRSVDNSGNESIAIKTIIVK